MNEICRHYIVKPLTGMKGTLQGQDEGIRFSSEKKAYCTHANSLHLPGSLVSTDCGGDVSKCDIPPENKTI